MKLFSLLRISIFMPLLFMVLELNAQTNYINYNQCLKLWSVPYTNYELVEFEYSKNYEMYNGNDSLSGEYYSFYFITDINYNDSLLNYFKFISDRNCYYYVIRDNEMIIEQNCLNCLYKIYITYYIFPKKSYQIEIFNLN